MNYDELRQLLRSGEWLRLDRMLAPRLVPLLYWAGLAAILVWALTHFIASFRYGFGSGVWGLVEIAVFGGLAIACLRLLSEAFLVFFRAHEDAAARAFRAPSNAPDAQALRDAIDDLAETVEEDPVLEPEAERSSVARATEPGKPAAEPGLPAVARRSTVKRTARRTPAVKHVDEGTTDASGARLPETDV